MSAKPKQVSLLLTEPPPSIGHTQVVDFLTVGEKGSKKFLAFVDMLSGYLEVFWFVLPPMSATIIQKLADLL